MMLPMIMIALCLFGGIGTFFFMKFMVSHKKQINTAQDFVNIVDIKDHCLYTKDDHVMSYFKIQPISIELLSEREKETLCNMLTAELSSLNEPFKFIAISRPVDISALISEYTDLLHHSSDQIQKALLRKEIYEMNDYALSGEVVERQFYIVLWQTYCDGVEDDLLKKTKDFIRRFESCGVTCTLLQEEDIVGLCSLINNAVYEKSEVE